MTEREKLREALRLAKDELHEMRIAQTNRGVPRNPELTQAAVKAVEAALAEPEALATLPEIDQPTDADIRHGAQYQFPEPEAAPDESLRGELDALTCELCRNGAPVTIMDDITIHPSGIEGWAPNRCTSKSAEILPLIAKREAALVAAAERREAEVRLKEALKWHNVPEQHKCEEFPERDDCRHVAELRRQASKETI